MSTLETLTGGLEKDVSISIEEITARLLDKTNIELKTEIPFKDIVWNTALIKSTGDRLQILFSDIPLIFKLDDGKGNKTVVPYGQFIRALYLKQVGYSEEYAISDGREGRKEIVSIAGRKFDQKIKHQDMLSAITGS